MNVDCDYLRPTMARISIRAKRVNVKMAILEKDVLLLRGALVRFERQRARLRTRIDKIQGKQRLEEEAKYKALMGDLDFAYEAMDKASKLVDQKPSDGKISPFLGVRGSLTNSDNIFPGWEFASKATPLAVELLESAMPNSVEPCEAILPHSVEPCEAILPHSVEPCEAILPHSVEPCEAILPHSVEPCEAILPHSVEPCGAILPHSVEPCGAILPHSVEPQMAIAPTFSVEPLMAIVPIKGSEAKDLPPKNASKTTLRPRMPERPAKEIAIAKRPIAFLKPSLRDLKAHGLSDVPTISGKIPECHKRLAIKDALPDVPDKAFSPPKVPFKAVGLPKTSEKAAEPQNPSDKDTKMQAKAIPLAKCAMIKPSFGVDNEILAPRVPANQKEVELQRRLAMTNDSPEVRIKVFSRPNGPKKAVGLPEFSKKRTNPPKSPMDIMRPSKLVAKSFELPKIFERAVVPPDPPDKRMALPIEPLKVVGPPDKSEVAVNLTIMRSIAIESLDAQANALASPIYFPSEMGDKMDQSWSQVLHYAEKCGWLHTIAKGKFDNLPEQRKFDLFSSNNRLLGSSGSNLSPFKWGGSPSDRNSCKEFHLILGELAYSPICLAIGIWFHNASLAMNIALIIKPKPKSKPKTTKNFLRENSLKDQCYLSGFDLTPGWFDSEWVDLSFGWYADESFDSELGCFDTEWVTHGFEIDQFTMSLGWAFGVDSLGNGKKLLPEEIPFGIFQDLNGMGGTIHIPNQMALKSLMANGLPNGHKKNAKDFGERLCLNGMEFSPLMEVPAGIMEFAGIETIQLSGLSPMQWTGFHATFLNADANGTMLEGNANQSNGMGNQSLNGWRPTHGCRKRVRFKPEPNTETWGSVPKSRSGMNANDLQALIASGFWPHIYGCSICPDGHGKDQICSNRIGMESREWVDPKLTSGQFLLSVGSVESFDYRLLISQALGEGVGEVSFPNFPKLVFSVLGQLFIANLAMNSPCMGVIGDFESFAYWQFGEHGSGARGGMDMECGTLGCG